MRIISAAIARELKMLVERFVRKATMITKVITVARNTDGGMPVSIIKNNKPIIVNTERR